MMQRGASQSKEVLRKSIRCGDVWKELFKTHSRIVAHTSPGLRPPSSQSAAKSESSTADAKQNGPWSTGERDHSGVFAQMDAFMQRCRDLIEVDP